MRPASHFKTHHRILVLTLCFSLGCASTNVGTVRDESLRVHLKRPIQIQVYDFTYEGIGKELREESAGLPREAAGALSNELVAHIRKLGLPADRVGAADTMPPRPRGDQSILVIRGSFVELDNGSGFKRVVFGFGFGASQVQTRTRLYYQTSEGEGFLKELATISKTGKMPGLLPPIGIGLVTGRLLMSAIVGAASTFAKRNDGAVGTSVRTADKLAEALEEYFIEKRWLRV
jgi:hypothetical protein